MSFQQVISIGSLNRKAFKDHRFVLMINFDDIRRFNCSTNNNKGETTCSLIPEQQLFYLRYNRLLVWTV